MIFNEELKIIWKEAAVASLTVPSRHLPRCPEDNCEVPEDSWSQGRGLHPEPAECDAIFNRRLLDFMDSLI
jgi:hypothetical protein